MPDELPKFEEPIALLGVYIGIVVVTIVALVLMGARPWAERRPRPFLLGLLIPILAGGIWGAYILATMR